MENDEKYSNIIDISEKNNKRTETKIFKIEYLGQNVSKNNEFKNWNNEMKTKYGKTYKLFYCSEEGLYFYGLRDSVIANHFILLIVQNVVNHSAIFVQNILNIKKIILNFVALKD